MVWFYEVYFPLLWTLTIVGGIVTCALMVLAYTRFMKGPFKRILFYVTLAFVVAVLSQVVRAASNVVLGFEDMRVEFISDFVFFVAIVCALRAAVLTRHFSKMYGFAKVPESAKK